jgi:glycosyltransferase involved in cell wall biosynthesis
MRIAFLSHFDPSDVKQWSGIGYYMVNSLRATGAQVDVYPVPLPKPSGLDTLLKIYWRLRGCYYYYDRSTATFQRWREKNSTLVETLQADVVLSPGSREVAAMGVTHIPHVFWTDATFGGLLDFYPHYRRLAASTIRNGMEAERSALARARLGIYSSEWAMETAIKLHGGRADRVQCIPFGANLEVVPDISLVNAAIASKLVGTLKILFLGVDWERKGGPLALKIFDLLRQRGLPAEFTIAGCSPRIEPRTGLKVLGFVSKRDVEGRTQLDNLLLSSHLLLLPTLADCTPMVLAEAYAYGLPVVTANVGGVSTQVEDGVDGYMLPRDATALDYTNVIEKLWSVGGTYERVAKAARLKYDSRLNWTSAASTVVSRLALCRR